VTSQRQEKLFGRDVECPYKKRYFLLLALSATFFVVIGFSVDTESFSLGTQFHSLLIHQPENF
jgi:hypothetical protein